MNPLKILAKILFWFHNNHYMEKLGFPSFSVFDPMCSRKKMSFLLTLILIVFSSLSIPADLCKQRHSSILSTRPLGHP